MTVSIDLVNYFYKAGFDQEVVNGEDVSHVKWTNDLYKSEIRKYDYRIEICVDGEIVKEIDLSYKGKSIDPIGDTIKYCDGVIKQDNRLKTIKKILKN